MPKQTLNPADFIVPLNMNGLNGRMLNLPPRYKSKKYDILLIYGIHSSIERMLGIAEELNKYGAITMPDLPGMGGMDSFYRIGQRPTIDNMADYLAAFVKMRYRRRRFTIMAMSFGFVVVTRMLQKYPDIARKVDLLVSVVGFVHRDDFRFSRKTYMLLRTTGAVFSRRLPAALFQYVGLRGPFIRATYNFVAERHSKLSDADSSERKKRIDFEVVLWKTNHGRTYMETGRNMLRLDLCDKRVDLPVYHVAVEPDKYFDNKIVEQHLNVIYSKVYVIASKIKGGHMPSVVATADEAALYFPAKLRRILSRH